MIGAIPDLKQVVSAQSAEVLDLYCYEQLPPEEEAEQSFIVATECALCDETLAVEIQFQLWAVKYCRDILQNYRFLCPGCSSKTH